MQDNPPMMQAPPIATPHRSGRTLRIALVALPIVGVVFSGLLLWMSLPLPRSADLLRATLCSPSEHVNCDYVLGSRWSKIGPMPTAGFGVIYFAALGIWFAATGLPNHRGRRWHFVPLILTSVGLCGSIWLIYVMAERLPVWCTWCVAAHVVNGLLFLLTLRAWPRKKDAAPGDAASRMAAQPSPLRAGLVLGGTTAVGLILLLAAMDIFHQATARQYQLAYLNATNNIEYIAWRYQRAAPQEIPIRPDDPSIGKRNAPFTVVIFSDFECPVCRELHDDVTRLAPHFSENLRFVFKHYPLSSECNATIPRSLHHYACQAAYAAEAVRANGNEAQTQHYYDLLYDNQDRFDERPYVSLAGRVGLEAGMIAKAISSEEVHRRVREDIALADRLGVKGTPALFLNGRRLVNWRIMTPSFQPRTDGQRTIQLWKQLLKNSN